jgi:putative aminopeptidase FrvX
VTRFDPAQRLVFSPSSDRRHSLLKELIKELTEAFGPSGSEDAVRQLIHDRISQHVDELRVDPLGNLIALRKHSRSAVERHKIMLAAHMDEIGVIVSYIDEKGFLRFAPVGGVRALHLLGSRVLFADGTIGVIGREKPKERTEFPSIDRMYIDVGAANKEKLSRKVGDVGAFVRPFVDMGQRMTAKAFDDRIGCAALVQTLIDLKKTPHDVYCVFTVQEEVGLRGALTSAFGVEPDVAIAVDVTLTGDTPEAHSMAVSLGEGPAIKVKDRGMLAHPGVKDWMVDTAERLGLPYQLEVLERGTTDAMAIQTSRAGVAAGVLSIPCRYVHSPSEMVDYADVQNAVRLLVGLLSGPVPIQ